MPISPDSTTMLGNDSFHTGKPHAAAIMVLTALKLLKRSISWLTQAISNPSHVS